GRRLERRNQIAAGGSALGRTGVLVGADVAPLDEAAVEGGVESPGVPVDVGARGGQWGAEVQQRGSEEGVVVAGAHESGREAVVEVVGRADLAASAATPKLGVGVVVAGGVVVAVGGVHVCLVAVVRAAVDRRLDAAVQDRVPDRRAVCVIHSRIGIVGD